MTNPSPASKYPSRQEMRERISRVSQETRGIWSKAHLAVSEAQLMRRTVQAQVEELCEDKEFRRRYRDGMLCRILRATIVATHAGMGNIQIFDPRSGDLQILVHEGFHSPFLYYFRSVQPGHAACGQALKSRDRVVVEDVTDSAVFAGDPSMEILLDAGVRAVQSTPLIGSQGQFLGVFSTHYPVPSRPTDADLRTLDYFSRRAAALLEWHDRGGLPPGMAHGQELLHAS